ncbi:MAG: T9SS type A sorting domain-containing protein [Candidatus Cloacimonetes bacterium]|nr:T9SS type A sorting domain-containing protein [Candidatus Cloacimonadota bacterium]
MKKTILIPIIVLLLSVSVIVIAQEPGDTLWTNSYGEANSDMGWCVQQTSDEGYIISGWTESFGAGSYDIYLVKTDEQGDTLWTRTYGEDGSDDARCIRQTPDGGYIIAGNTQPIGVMGSYIWLIKTNSLGDTLWTQKWGETPMPHINTGRCVQLTSDDGYIISGHSQFLGSNNEDICLIKTNSNGNTEWVNFYGGTNYEIGYWTQQTSDGGYIIVGYTTSFGNGNEDIYLVKTDASGTIEWTNTYGGTGTDFGYSVQQTSDDGYVIVGFTDSFGAGSYDVYVVKTDAVGDTMWTRTFGGANFDKGYSIQAISDGTYIVSGTTRSFGDPAGDVYLLKLDSSGDIIWSGTYGEANDDRGWSVQQTGDENYIVCGYTCSTGSADVYLLKIAGEGTGIENSVVLQEKIFVSNYPNPFNPSTTISFSLISESTENTELIIYNLKGQEIRQYSIFNNQSSIIWDGKDDNGNNVSSGIYLYKITSGNFTSIKKMILMK